MYYFDMFAVDKAISMAKISSKRVISFNVPQTEHEIVRVQQDTVPYFYDQLHQHPEIQVMLIESGEGTLIAGDYVGRFKAGEVYAIGSGQPHVFRCDQSYYEQKLEARSTSLYFNEKYFGEELWGANDMKAVREFGEATMQGIQFLPETAHTLADTVRHIADQEGLPRLISFFTLLNQITTSAGKKKLALLPGRLLENEESRMNSILDFTFHESHRKIYLTEVAQIANLSVEAFCRYFKIHTRKTYINFLNEVRVSHACQLLIRHELSVEQICYKAGFLNVSNFNRIFKRITHKTPLAFRRQLPFDK
jgi:AraC-like DNA-binding protein